MYFIIETAEIAEIVIIFYDYLFLVDTYIVHIAVKFNDRA